jgi:hypothetical protein
MKYNREISQIVVGGALIVLTLVHALKSNVFLLAGIAIIVVTVVQHFVNKKK